MAEAAPVNPKPTLCIVNFNGRNVLPTALAAARDVQDRLSGILVIDNGSQDGSADLVERDFAPASVIRLPENLGAGGARNVGLRRAPTDLILFIDNDVTLTASCVDELVRALAAHPRAALAAAAIVYAHRRDTVQYDGAECHFLGQQIMLDEDRPVASVGTEVRKIGSLSTCCFLVDRSRLPQGLEFDESYFYIFEDHDFSVRARALGAEILSVPAARCYHGQGTEGLSIRQIGTYSRRRVYFLIRNRWLFLLKVYSLRTLLVLTPALVVYECAQFLAVVKKGWLAEWWRSVRWIAGHWTDILRDRRRLQSLRRTPDRELLKGGTIPFRRELMTSGSERIARRVLDLIMTSYWRLASPLIR